MSREVEKKICEFCESEYKLMYNLDDTNGHPKFCPFCGSDVYDEDKGEEYDRDEE